MPVDATLLFKAAKGILGLVEAPRRARAAAGVDGLAAAAFAMSWSGSMLLRGVTLAVITAGCAALVMRMLRDARPSTVES